MSPVLYHHALSPSSRTALLTLRNVDLDEFEVKNIDINADEKYTVDYLKINPSNQVPVYVDDDFILTESRAIACYLASSVDRFYPTDLRKRALIDSRLFFDATNSSVRDFVFPVLRGEVKKIESDRREAVKDFLKILESFLLKSEWFAGDEVTIADFSYLANVATIKAWGVSFDEYPKLNSWYNRCKDLPGFSENKKGAQLLSKKMSILLDEPLWKKKKSSV
ncbi:glutathione S-transferase 1-like [Bradysia coprophila]|uniref:glutathione S-transferase 1-like n=1 Tax=Bradysia coprophila TaxID=38358 RepID=UPI00187DC125|nr:glutathione S-transferase 1-like [Bradysia coprophila]